MCVCVGLRGGRHATFFLRATNCHVGPVQQRSRATVPFSKPLFHCNGPRVGRRGYFWDRRGGLREIEREGARKREREGEKEKKEGEEGERARRREKETRGRVKERERQREGGREKKREGQALRGVFWPCGR